jgi:hypothetical protein
MAHSARRAFGLVLCAVAVGALGACGGTSKEDYRKQIDSIIDPVGGEIGSLLDRVKSQTSREARIAEITETEKAIDAGVDKLEDVEPPDGVKKQHEEYIEKLRTVGGDMGLLEQAATAQDANALGQAILKLETDGQALKTAEDALSEKIK